MATKQSPKDFGSSWLSRSGFEQYFLSRRGLAYYPWLGTEKLLSNPSQLTSTGHSIFQEPASLEAITRSLRLLFRRCRRLSGGIYRWNGVAACLRRTMPSVSRVVANVVGDGQHIMRELIAIKNDNPLRGRASSFTAWNHWTGDIELLMDQQGGPDGILPAGQDLRRNSNIYWRHSIDVTDSMHPSYKLPGHGKAMEPGPGVDLIIPDSSAISIVLKIPTVNLYRVWPHPMYMATCCAEGLEQSITWKYWSKISFPEMDLARKRRRCL